MMMMDDEPQDDDEDVDEWLLVDDKLTASVGRVVEGSLAGVRRSDDTAVLAAIAASTFVAGCVGADQQRTRRSPPPAV
jgi:hypothetical protein